MSESVKVCFDINQENFQALKRVAKAEGLDCSQYVSSLVEGALKDFISRDRSVNGNERRRYMRVDVSLPAISCVKFSDREMRSYPVMVDDISQGGLRISFKDIPPELAEKLATSSFFEVFFTLPHLSQTVSFYCRRLRHKVDRDVTMVGVFEGSNPETVSMVDAMMEYYTA
ncbi:PilZ domain-containing protein [uncultured Pseudodesulfovibrio sp.]|uniref:PilZ domain-containing protein n=1 Tax=uncultured Pseudodesulfovibrio sp. TaxID=2035858 RepID=UPI00374A5264